MGEGINHEAPKPVDDEAVEAAPEKGPHRDRNAVELWIVE
jgi:hypothetical protein